MIAIWLSIPKTTYPDNPEMNVKYQYGAPNSGNETGRLIYQEDATGIQQFKYGKLGELTENIRTFVLPDQQIFTFAMQWNYDTWNRIKTITYADGEVVSYGYNRAGMLVSMDGVKGNDAYSYLKEQGYDKYGSKNMMKYGNDITTYYIYDIGRFRLSGLYALDIYGDTVQKVGYHYDASSNIIAVEKSAERGVNGVPYNATTTYQYDDANRLTYSQGSMLHQNNYSFLMAYSYSASGKINQKVCDATTLTVNGANTVYYNNTYGYSGTKPHAVSQINNGDIQYEWTPNGNMKTEYNQVTNKLMRLVWDEENRLNTVLSPDKSLNYYTYDASGERTLKLTGNLETMNINGQYDISAYSLNNNYTLYTSGYMVINPKLYTKHYYIEGDRIVSKIGGGMKANITPLDNHIYAFDIQSLTDYYTKSDTNDQMMYRFFDSCMVYEDVFVYEDFDWLNDCATNNYFEEDVYFYHKDHLGSSTQITDGSATVIHHMEYMPSGELFTEQRGHWESLYKFNSKELDQETGLYYYGARYYNPTLSIWGSVDPLADDAPGWTPYRYCFNNPINLIDPDGMSEGNPDWFENKKTGDVYYNNNMHQGDEGTGAMTGDGWIWMGPNGMFQEPSGINNDAALAFANGGTVELVNSKPFSYVKDQINTEMMLTGKKAKLFMKNLGYKSNPTQQVIYRMKFFVSIQGAPVQPSVEIRITEKSRYMKDDFVETGHGAIVNVKIKSHKYFNEYVGRYNIHYSNNRFATTYLSIFNTIYPNVTPVLFNNWSEYRNNVEFINEFKRKYGTK